MTKYAVYRGFNHAGVRLNRGETLPDSIMNDPVLSEELYRKGILAKVKNDGTLMRWLVPVHDFRTVPPHAKRDYTRHLLENGQIDPISIPKEYRDEPEPENRPGPGRPRKEDQA